MPQQTRGKQRSPTVVQFDSLQTLSFPAITLANNQLITTVAASIALPTNYKFYRLQYVYTSAAAGTANLNIVLGTGAEGAVGTPDNTEAGGTVTVAPAGAILFAADQALTQTNNTPTQINVPAPNFDVIWPSNGLLTLRIAGGAAAAGVLQVSLLGKPVDTGTTVPKPINAAFDATIIP